MHVNREELREYVEGTVDQLDYARIHTHMQICRSCRDALRVATSDLPIDDSSASPGMDAAARRIARQREQTMPANPRVLTLIMRLMLTVAVVLAYWFFGGTDS